MPSPQSDDHPHPDSSQQDRIWRRSLERAIGKLFYEKCSGVLQGLLTSCEWHFSNQNLILTLWIECRDQATKLRVLNNISEISRVLETLTPYALVKVNAPLGERLMFEVQLDQFSTS